MSFSSSNSLIHLSCLMLWKGVPKLYCIVVERFQIKYFQVFLFVCFLALFFFFFVECDFVNGCYFNVCSYYCIIMNIESCLKLFLCQLLYLNLFYISFINMAYCIIDMSILNYFAHRNESHLPVANIYIDLFLNLIFYDYHHRLILSNM